MLKTLRNLIIFALLVFALWPYATLFQLNNALGKPDAEALAPLVDLAAVQAHYKSRFGDTVNTWLPNDGQKNEILGWLSKNIQDLGDGALDQAITLDWIRDALREAIRRASPAAPGSFLKAVDFAFFESWNRFVIRLGALGENPTHLILSLDGYRWKVTDIAL